MTLRRPVQGCSFSFLYAISDSSNSECESLVTLSEILSNHRRVPRRLHTDKLKLRRTKSGETSLTWATATTGLTVRLNLPIRMVAVFLQGKLTIIVQWLQQNAG